MSYDVKALEFDKILNEVSGFTHWSKTKEYILNLMPIINLDELNIMQNEEREAYNAIIKYDDLPLLELDNIIDVLKSNDEVNLLDYFDIDSDFNFIVSADLDDELIDEDKK